MDRYMLDSLDLLVGLDSYRSRSEAIRELMKRGLEAHEDVRKLGSAVKLIKRHERDGEMDLSGLALEKERL